MAVPGSFSPRPRIHGIAQGAMETPERVALHREAKEPGSAILRFASAAPLGCAVQARPVRRLLSP